MGEAGEGGDVIEPGRLPKQRPSAGQLKAPLGSKFTVSSNGSHLFGCHSSTGERWEGGGGGGCGCEGGWWGGGSEQASQNISPGKKRKQHRRLSPRNVHHTRSLHSPHTSQQTRVYPPSAPAFFALPLFALSFRKGWLPLQKKMLKGGGKKAERTTGATIGAPLAACFRFTCHRVEVEKFPCI